MRKTDRWLRALSIGIHGTATVLAATACQSDDGGASTPPPSGPIALEDFPVRYADALCNEIGPCCQAAGYPYDRAACHMKAQTEAEKAVARVQTNGDPYNPDTAGVCVDTLTSLTRTCSDADVETAFETTCGMVFRESRPPGSSCTSGQHCADGAGCNKPPDGGAGACVGPMGAYRGKEGVACGSTCFRDATSGGLQCVALDPSAPNTKAQCWAEDGIFCDPQSQVCTPSPVLGQPCATGLPCRDDAYCPSGVCVAKGTSGPCGMFGEACASTAYCDRGTQQCVPRRPRGESCSSNVECATTDQCDMTCRPITIATEDTCMGDT